MFDFFKTKNKQEDIPSVNDDVVASITFFISSDNIAAIDIGMSDYSPVSVSGMCELINLISTEQASIQAVNMIKNGLIENKQEDVLFTLLSNINLHVTNSLLEQSMKDKPCIKPSDML